MHRHCISEYKLGANGCARTATPQKQVSPNANRETPIMSASVYEQDGAAKVLGSGAQEDATSQSPYSRPLIKRGLLAAAKSRYPVKTATSGRRMRWSLDVRNVRSAAVNSRNPTTTTVSFWGRSSARH